MGNKYQYMIHFFSLKQCCMLIFYNNEQMYPLYDYLNKANVKLNGFVMFDSINNTK